MHVRRTTFFLLTTRYSWFSCQPYMYFTLSLEPTFSGLKPTRSSNIHPKANRGNARAKPVGTCPNGSATVARRIDRNGNEQARMPSSIIITMIIAFFFLLLWEACTALCGDGGDTENQTLKNIRLRRWGREAQSPTIVDDSWETLGYRGRRRYKTSRIPTFQTTYPPGPYHPNHNKQQKQREIRIDAEFRANANTTDGDEGAAIRPVLDSAAQRRNNCYQSS